MYLRNNRGFTLVEVLVAMGIFLTIMMITASSFESIAKHTVQQSKSAETLQEGIVGLEVLRSDLKQAGFGLPWTVTGIGAGYKEAQIATGDYPAAGFWPATTPPGSATNWVTSFNDAPSSAPRAVQSANTAFNVGSDGQGSKYLVIKSMLVGTSTAARKWTNVAYANGTRKATLQWTDSSRNFASDDRVVVVKNSLTSVPPARQLLTSAGTFSTTFANFTTLTTNHLDGDSYEVYGVDRVDPSAPFNRADFYVMTPASGMPAECAPHTGILYKGVLNHATGSFTQIPLLDCVADLQVVYGVDASLSGTGTVNDHLTDLSGKSAEDIRNQVCEIRVYLLSHEGKKDLGYTYPSPYVTVGENFGGSVKGRTFDLQTQVGTDWQHYRWKVHTIVVRPKNLF
ncbi:type IV pilus minor pilin PilW [Geomonas limicola]|uniref:Type IV pilus minor pilin PilW n=1 Tax=Geomonas limicola TaxID=2740186 RepID=A0A6V8N2S0_9BACT|nr:prepilin-type N-terminal cleavage/methylation domain-containing protein [Geomonas limicola]GFO66845.1 type IV pilus minor pilin PilW [Geomonas limicola]